MIHGINERDQLARLHDRHKKLSLDVYDHLNDQEEKEMLEAHKELKKTEKELEDLQKKLYPKK
ncbi:hypothetical protein I2486_14790 [Cellulophaga sp. E16_2]|uniref:Uncharacterized protein n=1 Tax=Cellulophaga algicola (strain DSM 14237 / IC166 / ACAM 630) TaxID=688270 RepID=E6XEH6_CELAD|nr:MULTISPECIES: hypothetical protein [Cellulophaga]ADV50266.1 hypothetical protein Celal_2991 [Cellulophaga algicola DSM 14237]MBO0592669.1 hypothetical protein [Cellulophaga sp. E16_2]